MEYFKKILVILFLFVQRAFGASVYVEGIYPQPTGDDNAYYCISGDNVTLKLPLFYVTNDHEWYKVYGTNLGCITTNSNGFQVNKFITVQILTPFNYAGAENISNVYLSAGVPTRILYSYVTGNWGSYTVGDYLNTYATTIDSLVIDGTLKGNVRADTIGSITANRIVKYNPQLEGVRDFFLARFKASVYSGL